MNELDKLYVTLLRRGLVSIRNASRNGDLELCKAESEYFHEIPSLIGETNRLCHLYQATKVRPAFMAWVKTNQRYDVHESIEMWYLPVWRRIDEILGIEPTQNRDAE